MMKNFYMLAGKGRRVVAGLSVLSLSLCGAADAGALTGKWTGELSLGPAKLPLVFNFSEDDSGQTSCTLDSPMQGAKGIASKVTFCSADSIALEMASIGAAYSGRVNGNEIDGIFSQMGHSFPLKLSGERPLSERRPQTPAAPFPYQTVDTVFMSADGTILAGTLTLPESMKPGTPAVVMVTGSGPQNRDEEIFDHKPFAVIADFLARRGVASFRYDDRGTASSGGNFSTSDIDTFKEDADAALSFLKSIGGIGKTGVLGHSEGGTIALMLASEGKGDFAVSLAGLATPGKDMLIGQNVHALGKLGLSGKQVEDAVKLIELCYDDIIAGKNYQDMDIDGYISAGGLDVPPMVVASMKRNFAAAQGNYFRKMLMVNPQEWLGKIAVPVLAVNGSNDTQVYAKENLESIRSHVKGAEVREYPGLNHLFQHCTTGEVDEYYEITETISPEVLEAIAGFIL